MAPSERLVSSEWRVASRNSLRPTPYPYSLELVGLGRLELPTSRLSSARSNQLSYKPKLSQPRGLSPGGLVLRRKRNEDGGCPAEIGLTGRCVPSDPIGHEQARSDKGSSLERR